MIRGVKVSEKPRSAESPKSAMTRTERETLRQSFRPVRVQLLFIGESPPASGRFFYSRNSGLYRAVRAAFQIADSSISDDAFLESFMHYGCYLTDLSSDPVDHLDVRERQLLSHKGERRLTRQIQNLEPKILAPVLRSISANVRSAASRADWSGEILDLPYPGRWVRNRSVFINTLVPVLHCLKS